MLHNNNPIFIADEVCNIPAGNQHTETKVSSTSFIKFPITRGYHFIKSKSILYLKSESNYTYVYFTDGKSQLYSKTLKILSSYLSDDDFIRIHASYVVNKLFITSINNHVVTLNETLRFPVSRKLYKSILQIFSN